MEEYKLSTATYIVDKDKRIIYCNPRTRELYPEAKPGELCYKIIALKQAPCEQCPLRDGNVLFYTPIRQEWIAATAAEIEVPGYGLCYNVQFQMRSRNLGDNVLVLQREVVAEYLEKLGIDINEKCMIGAYCEPGSPVFYANDQMIELLGYDSWEDLYTGIAGLVVNIVHPDDRARVRADVQKYLSPGDTYETVYRMPKKDGSWIWSITKGTIIETEDGKTATISVCEAMSDFIKGHEALVQRNQLLRDKSFLLDAMMQNIPGGYHRCGTGDGYPFLYTSENFLKIIGWTEEELESKFDNKYLNLVFEEDRGIFEDFAEEIGEQVQASRIYRIQSKDKGYRWIQDSTMLVDLEEDSFYQGCVADVTDYVEGIEREKRRAEEGSRAKSAFLFNASHDIRTPMNAIVGFAHMIEQNAGDAQLVQEMIAKILKASDSLTMLLNNVLELSRIESGKDEPDLTVVDLNSFMDKLYLMFAQEIKAAGIHFQIQNNLQNPVVWCDELKCLRILINMLSNAKKFTAAGGNIVCGIEQLEQGKDCAVYRLYVKDSGIGMSKEFQERAFEQFERARTATDSGIEGSGLGLAIIKKMIDQMDGQCVLNSEIGVGTEIAAVLKFRLADEGLLEKKQDVPATIDLSGKRVLLVEDNAFNRDIARYVLENAGIQVEEAENGLMAVEKVIQSEVGYYDVVLMDIQMPIMDGYKATGEIRRLKEPGLASVPIIAMTANAFKEDRDKCLAAGMDGHMSKPIDAEEVLQQLAHIIQVRQRG